MTSVCRRREFFCKVHPRGTRFYGYVTSQTLQLCENVGLAEREDGIFVVRIKLYYHVFNLTDGRDG